MSISLKSAGLGVAMLAAVVTIANARADASLRAAAFQPITARRRSQGVRNYPEFPDSASALRPII
jgi:hypothetical protein